MRRPSTSTVLSPTYLPSPVITSISCAATNPCKPLYNFATTPSLYVCTPAMSMPSKLLRTPTDALSRAVSATSAQCSRAFVGIQPRCRQVPPTMSFSISVTDMPSCDARKAHA